MDVHEKINNALSEHYPDANGNVAILAMAYYIYKAKKRDWIEQESIHCPNMSDDKRAEVVAQFVLHNTSDMKIKEFVNNAVGLWNTWTNHQLNLAVQQKKPELTSMLIGEIEKSLGDKLVGNNVRISDAEKNLEEKFHGNTEKIISNLNERTKDSRAFYINVAASIIGPLLVVVLVWVITFTFPEALRFSEHAAKTREQMENSEQAKENNPIHGNDRASNIKAQKQQ